MVVHPSVSAKTVLEFIDYANANPGKINYGSAGTGTAQHVASELFKMKTGVGMVHVPYRGEALALNDLLGGQVQFMIAGISIEHIKAGRLRALAVTSVLRSGRPTGPLPDPEPVSGAQRDTTHIAIIDRDGNIFDSTPSGGWIGGAVILGNTGIGMSVRGEQFWLDKTRAAQLVTPSIVLRAGEPFMALGSPGGDNQDQTILQAFLDIVEFWPVVSEFA
jgi:hypothetical protein